MRWLRRVLGGEFVDNQVGIRIRGGPFDGRVRIMSLDAAGSPPLRTRGQRYGQVWHAYVLAAEPDAASSWIYLYAGEEPVDDAQGVLGLEWKAFLSWIAMQSRGGHDTHNEDQHSRCN